MNQQTTEKGKSQGGRGLLDMVRNLLKRDVPEMDTVPTESTVKRLVEKACDGKMSTAPDGENESCPYVTKRAIVESLAEIRRFAEEHKLAAEVVKALLTLLAEMVIEALRGKVSGKVLDLLLKAIHYDEARMEAYADGEKAGRNARIKMEVFPEQEKEIPDLNGAMNTSASPSSIFDIAREAN